MKHEPIPEELVESEWDYDEAPSSISPYKLLGMLAIAAVATGISGYGYYAFVKDPQGHVSDLICVMLSLLGAIALFTHAIRRDGFEWGFRWFTIGTLFLVPFGLFVLFFTGALRLANVWLDFSEEKTSIMPVSAKTTDQSKRMNQLRSNRELLFVREDDGQRIPVPIKRELYDAAKPGDLYTIVTRSGALGREWIVRAVPIK